MWGKLNISFIYQLNVGIKIMLELNFNLSLH